MTALNGYWLRPSSANGRIPAGSRRKKSLHQHEPISSSSSFRRSFDQQKFVLPSRL